MDKSEDTAALVGGGSKSIYRELKPSHNLLSSTPGSSKKSRISNNPLASNKDLIKLGSRPVLTNAKILNSDYFLSHPKNVSSKFLRKCSKFSRSSEDTEHFASSPANEYSKSGVIVSLVNKFSKTKPSSPTYVR